MNLGRELNELFFFFGCFFNKIYYFVLFSNPNRCLIFFFFNNLIVFLYLNNLIVGGKRIVLSCKGKHVRLIKLQDFCHVPTCVDAFGIVYIRNVKLLIVSLS